jgi:hypothetical protein
MTDSPIPTIELSSTDKILQQKFAESITGQNELMDKLGQQLIAMELAIPGLYATILKLMSGDKATVAAGKAFYLTFACWFLALLLTLISLMPRKWKVDPTVMKQDEFSQGGELGIEDFFYKTAQYKRRLLISSSLLFFIGVVSAAYSVFL